MGNCNLLPSTDKLKPASITTVLVIHWIHSSLVIIIIVDVQGGSNMTGTDLYCLHTNQSRSYLNHLVYSFYVLSYCYKFSNKYSLTKLFYYKKMNLFFNICYMFRHHPCTVRRIKIYNTRCIPYRTDNTGQHTKCIHNQNS